MDKKAIRQEVLQSLRHLSKEQKQTWTENLYQQLFQTAVWQTAQSIGVTLSMGVEIETRPIIEQAWAQDKQVFVPVITPDKKMIFTNFTKDTPLVANKMGIEEPSEISAVAKSEIDLLITPGVVYRPDGYRIGFGGGYYDRFLVDYTGHTISLALPVQIVANWTPNRYDMAVEKILTVN